MQNVLKKYVRRGGRRGGRRVGLLVAVKNDSGVSIGWSRCHIQKDEFNPELADRIATGRAMTGHNGFPSSFLLVAEHFAKRAARFFKDSTVVTEIVAMPPKKASVDEIAAEMDKD